MTSLGRKGPRDTDRAVPGEEGRLHRATDAALPYITIGVLAGLVYANSIDASFHYDDVHVVVENLGIRGPRAFLDYLPYHMNRPLLAFTFALNYAFSGLDPGGYRVTNILLHVLNGCLIYRWVKELVLRWVPIPGRRRFDVEKIAWMASLLFVAHPIATEAVTYISSRSSVLCTTFILLCLICWDEALWRGGKPRPAADEEERPRVPGGGERTSARAWPWRMGAVLFLLAALGTKEIAASLPVILLACDALLVRPRLPGFRRRLVRFHPVFFSILAFALLVRGMSTSGFDRPPPGLGVGQYWSSEIRALAEYVRMFLFPTNLTVDPDFAPSFRFDLPVAASLAGVLASVALAVSLARRVPIVSFGIVFFPLAHAPTSLIPLQDLVADRREYLPSIGLLLALSWGLFTLARSPLGARSGASGEPAERRGWAGALASFSLWAVMLGCFSVGTIHRNSDWQNPVSLWMDAVRKAPEKARPHSNLGSALEKSGDAAGALREYGVALDLDPNYADAHLNLGTLLTGLGRHDEALAHLEKAAELAPGKPTARNRVGELYIGWGQAAKAEEILGEVARGPIADRETYYLLGLAHYRMGNLKDAERDWQEGSHRWPRDGRLHRSLGLLFYKEGRTEETFFEFRQAVKEDPTEWAAQAALRELEAGRQIQVR